MTRALTTLAIFIATLAAQLVLASEQSKMLQSRGLVEFHAGRYDKALGLFDEAVAADPQDIFARYYRGVTRGRLGDSAGSIADLRAVVAANPELDQAAVDLGVALVQSGAYADAVPLLQQAQRSRELEPDASLFLGVAQLRLGQIFPARQNFARAAARKAELRLPAEYYEGVANYREGFLAEAEAHFQNVVRESADSQMGREAKTFLAMIHNLSRPRFTAFGTLGLQYDSNVALAPSDDVIKSALGISGQEDGRVLIDVGGNYTPWRSERAELLVGYEFYQSLHFDLGEFDIQDHAPNVELLARTQYFQFGVLGRYDYYLLDSENFLQEATALPWVTVPEGDLGRVDIFYRMRRRDFLAQEFRVRDAFNHAPGFRQSFHLAGPDRYVSVGYRFDREDPIAARDARDANQFAYDGHEVGAGFGWILPWEVTGDVWYAFRRERYAPPSHGRRDEEHLATISAGRRFGERVQLIAAYYGTFSKSNDKRFEYERQIGAIAVEVRY
jgi:Tfp pilus assembly protein PilF